MVPIPGTKRATNLEENAAAAEIVGTADDLRRISDAVPAEAVVGERYGDTSHIDS